MRGQKISQKCPHCRGTGINKATTIDIDKNGLILAVTPELLKQMKALKTRGKTGYDAWMEKHKKEWESKHKRPIGMPIEKWNKLGITWEEWKNGKYGNIRT